MHKFAPLPLVGLIAALSQLALSQPALAQDAPATVQQDPVQPEDPVVEGNEIVVTGRSLRDQVRGPEAPIIELDEEDIAAYAHVVIRLRDGKVETIEQNENIRQIEA